MIVENLDYTLIMGDTDVRLELIATIAEGVSSQAGSDIFAEHVQVTLSAGSTAATIRISPPFGTDPRSVQTQLRSSTSLRETLLQRIKEVSGISAVSSGSLAISSISTPVLSTDSTSTTTGTSSTSTSSTATASTSTTSTTPRTSSDAGGTPSGSTLVLTTLGPNASAADIMQWQDSITSETMEAEQSLAEEALRLSRAARLLRKDAGNATVLLTMSRTTSTGSITATVVDASAAMDAGSHVTISVEGLNVELPPAVLNQALGGDISSPFVAAVATVLNDASAAGLLGDRGLSGHDQPIISLNLVSANYTLKGVQLAEPIILTLLAEKVPGAQCAFWDEILRVWSAQGMQEVPSANGTSFKCSTTHLTVFAAVVQEFLTAWQCSNADLISKEGLRALGASLWFLRPATLVFLALLLVQIVILARSFYLDRRAQRQCLWRTNKFFTEERAFANDSQPIAQKVKQQVCQIGEKLDLEKFVMFCNHQSLAQKSRIRGEDIDLFVSAVAEHEEVANQSWVLRKVGDDMLQALQAAPGASKTFWSSSLRARIWILFVAMHPWINLGYFSIRMSSVHRALLLGGKLLGSLAISGLFFSTTSEAMSYHAPEECEQNDVWAFIWRNIIIGLFSQFLSTIPLLFVALAQRRRFRFRENWSDDLRRRYAWRLAVVDRIFEATILLYSTACTIFVAVFLAGLSAHSGLHWVTMALSGVVRDILVAPCCLAVGLASGSWLIAHKRPHIVDDVQDKVEEVTLMRLAKTDTGGASELSPLASVVPNGPPNASFILLDEARTSERNRDLILLELEEEVLNYPEDDTPHLSAMSLDLEGISATSPTPIPPQPPHPPPTPPSDLYERPAPPLPGLLPDIVSETSCRRPSGTGGSFFSPASRTNSLNRVHEDRAPSLTRIDEDSQKPPDLQGPCPPIPPPGRNSSAVRNPSATPTVSETDQSDHSLELISAGHKSRSPSTLGQKSRSPSDSVSRAQYVPPSKLPLTTRRMSPARRSAWHPIPGMDIAGVTQSKVVFRSDRRHETPSPLEPEDDPRGRGFERDGARARDLPRGRDGARVRDTSREGAVAPRQAISGRDRDGARVRARNQSPHGPFAEPGGEVRAPFAPSSTRELKQILPDAAPELPGELPGVLRQEAVPELRLEDLPQPYEDRREPSVRRRSAPSTAWS